MEIKWNDIDELPVGDEGLKKLLILYSGIHDKDRLFVSSSYWNMFIDDRELPQILYDKVVRLDDGRYAYGKLCEENIPFGSIKSWMESDNLIQLYHEQKGI